MVTAKQTPRNKVRKYKIEECLNNLNHQQYRFARRVLPKIIGKCQNTLNNYINIPMNSKEEIPYTVGVKLEQFFGLEPGELTNEKFQIGHHSTLYQQWVEKSEDLDM